MRRRYALVCALLLAATPAWAGSWSDDFEDAASVDWEEAGEIADWTESDGVLNGELLESNVRSLRITGDDRWEDYTVTCRANVQNLAGGDWTGIVFRYQNEDAYAWLGLSVAWTKFAAGIGGATDVEQQIKVGFRQWYVLRAVVKGALVECYVDDELLFELEGGLPISGSVGVFSARSLPQFDDFNVKGDDVADGGPGFAVAPAGKLALTWAGIRARR